MANKNPQKIQPEQRGHRKPLDPDGTEMYNIRVTKKLKRKLLEIGPESVREHLKEVCSGVQPESTGDCDGAFDDEGNKVTEESYQ